MALVQRVWASKSDFGSPEAWNASFAEFIATLLFVFVGAGSVVATGALTGGDLDPARLVAIALAHGLAITLLVYATANLSGGHINPAVSFAAALTGKISPTKASMYIMAQLGGAVVGALLLKISLPEEGNLGAHALGSGVNVGMGVLIETILTFVLVFTIFTTAIDPKGMGRLAPLAIGLAVLVGHIAAVTYTGASMNPARSLGPAVVAGAWTDHWVYWVGPMVGGVLASLIYQVFFVSRAPAEEARLVYPEAHLDARALTSRGLLKDVDVFRNLSDAQIDTVKSIGQISNYSAGTSIGSPGELGNSFYVVTKGNARLSTSSPIGEISVRIAGSGETFPLAALVGSGSLVTSVEALTDTELLVIPRPSLLQLFKENPELGMSIYSAVAEVIGSRYRNTVTNLATRTERLRSELQELESRSRWPF